MKNWTLSEIEATEWVEAESRSWERRRELGPDQQPACDKAASLALALLARKGGEMPHRQRFTQSQSEPSVRAWMGDFSWGRAWCVSDESRLLWALQSADKKEPFFEISGSAELWDEELGEECALRMSEARVWS